MKIDQNMCIGCQACKMTCPMGAINLNADNKCEIDKSKCVSCGQCASVCPMGAIASN